MPLSGSAQIFSFDQLNSDASASDHRLGDMAHTPDGRKYRFAKAGGTDLVAGTLQQCSAIVANHQNMSLAAAAIGDFSVTVTLGATAATADQYAEGYLIVNDGTGQGHTYLIKDHPAADASATLAVNLYEPIKVALVASGTSQVSLVANPYNGTVIYPTTPTGVAAGVAPFAVDDADYYWCQTHGVASVLMDGAPAAGSGLSPSNAVAGAVETHVLAQGFVGNALQLGVDTEYNTAFLMID